MRNLHGRIEFERERNAVLSEEVQRLKHELDQTKLELMLERQNKFATSKQKQADPTGKQVAVPSKSTSGKLGRRPSVILVGIDRRLRYVTGAST